MAVSGVALGGCPPSSSMWPASLWTLCDRAASPRAPVSLWDSSTFPSKDLWLKWGFCLILIRKNGLLFLKTNWCIGWRENCHSYCSWLQDITGSCHFLTFITACWRWFLTHQGKHVCIDRPLYARYEDMKSSESASALTLYWNTILMVERRYKMELGILWEFSCCLPRLLREGERERVLWERPRARAKENAQGRRMSEPDLQVRRPEPEQEGGRQAGEALMPQWGMRI